jgi:hypothetical protein
MREPEIEFAVRYPETRQRLLCLETARGKLNLIGVFQTVRILVCNGEFREPELIELGA